MANENESAMHTRVQVVETRLDHIEGGIRELTKAVKELAAAPRALPLKEIAMTVGAVLAIVAYVGNFLETQYKKNVAVLEHRVTVIERTFASMPRLMIAPPHPAHD